MVSADLIQSSGEAAAVMSSSLSDKIFILQPTLAYKKSSFYRKIPQKDLFKVSVLRSFNDPFQIIADYRLENPESKITVYTDLLILFNGLVHLSELLYSNIVIHVNLSERQANGSYPDYALLSALRHSNYVFLQSFSIKDSQDTSIVAQLVASKLTRGVIHFFGEDSDAKPISQYSDSKVADYVSKFAPLKTEEESEASSTPIKTADLLASVEEILGKVGSGYKPFEYYGSSSVKNVIVLFGWPTDPFVQAVSQSNDIGLVLIRAYRPWSSKNLIAAIPKTVSKLAFAEQVYTQTTSWGALVQDFITDIYTQGDIKYSVVSVQVGKVSYDNVRTVVKSISANLSLDEPIQKLFVGDKFDLVEIDEESRAAQEAAKNLEDAYTKVLHQLFGDRLSIINAKDKLNTGFENTPEYGFGKYLANLKKYNELSVAVKRVLKANDFPVLHKQDLLQLLSQWAVNPKDVDPKEINDLLVKSKESSKSANVLLDYAEQFLSKSPWLIGSDSWAYDLGNSGVHHVVTSGKNINMLIIDSKPYSEITKDPLTPRKKDIGLYAMNSGKAYVASVAVYSSYTQLLQALIEAEKFEGPSVVVAYLPYNDEHENALAVMQETKRAVDSGYWPLYRYDPSEESPEKVFKLDSFQIRKSLQDFLDRENKLTLLSSRSPTFARSLNGSYGAKVKTQQNAKAREAYARLLEGLSGPPVTILFASDGGTAESVGKRLQRRAKARGLKAVAMAFDDYPIEDLANEENVVFITSTAGQGEFPQNGRAFWDALKGSTDIDLGNVKTAVFGLGDSLYWPRKEDKIYYNKPCKDLYNKLSLFGSTDLVPLGLGDEQDADQYSTAYNEWESLLWKALNVDGIATADEPPPVTNEDIKINSNFLRGTIAEGLKDQSTGAISASDQQLTKFHGIYMQDDRDIRDDRKASGLEPAYSFMIRVRLPGCVSTPDQWLKIDELSDSRGNGTFKITTRGTFQLHGVIKENLKPAIRGMNSALMDTVAACGDVDRNVVAAALPGNAKIHDEVVQFAYRISEHLLPQTTAYYEIWLEGQDEGDGPDYTRTFEARTDGPIKKPKKELVSESGIVDHEPLYGPVYLPRKFKINIAVPPYNDVDVFAHDVGLIAIVEDNELVGFNVLAGGGMGTTHNNRKTYPRTGSILGYVPKDKVIAACEKIMLVQRDFGDRKNRKHARLKYTIDDLGVEVFKDKVEELLGFKFESAREYHFESNTDHFGWVTDETGLHHFTTFVENGRVEDTPELQFKTGLRELAKYLKSSGAGEFRLTANQHILVSKVTDAQLPSVKQIMARYKLDNVAFSGLRLSSAACVAFPTCGLAMAESERYLPVLIDKVEEALEEYGLRRDSIVMRMTGCPNGCARPWLAEVALVGKAFGAYNLMLGGGYQGQRLNKLYKSSIKEDEILSILKPLFKRWALERKDGEHFGDFLIRTKVIAETTEGKNFWDHVPEDA